jgi:hypothetical protein
MTMRSTIDARSSNIRQEELDVAATLAAPHLQLCAAGKKLAKVSEYEPPCARPLVEVFVSDERQRLTATVARQFFIVVACPANSLSRIERILSAFAPLHSGCESTREPSLLSNLPKVA